MKVWRGELTVVAALRVVILTIVCGGALAQQPQIGQSAGQDFKDAARSTKSALKKSSVKVEKAVKKGLHKAAEAVRVGTEKVVEMTKPD